MAFITQIVYESPLCDSRTKAIRLWSGDQAGSESLNGPVGSEIAGNPTLRIRRRWSK